MISLTFNGDNNTVHLDPLALAELPPDDQLLIAVKQEELDQILAALRLWQRTPGDQIPLEIHAIACGERECTLTDAEIDELCEGING